jgi:hypothetical protein
VLAARLMPHGGSGQGRSHGVCCVAPVR